MENQKPPLEPALRALAGRAEDELGEHPSPETLAAYHEGHLEGTEAERLRDHLALCTDCAQLLLDLGGFADLTPPAGTRGLTDAEVDAAWQAVQTRLPGSGEPPSASNVVRLPPPVSAPTARPARPASWIWALAASWVAVVGLAFWVVALQREIGRRSGASAEVVVADLSAIGGDTTRGQERPHEPVLSARRRIVLHLAAAGLPAFGGYEVEVQEEGTNGRVVWSGRAERDPVESDFTVDLPPGFLRPALYQVHLWGLDSGTRRKMADFTFQVGAS